MPAATCSNCGAPNFISGAPGGRVKCSSCGNTFRVDVAYGPKSAGATWVENLERQEAVRLIRYLSVAEIRYQIALEN